VKAHGSVKSFGSGEPFGVSKVKVGDVIEVLLEVPLNVMSTSSVTNNPPSRVYVTCYVANVFRGKVQGTLRAVDVIGGHPVWTVVSRRLTPDVTPFVIHRGKMEVILQGY